MAQGLVPPLEGAKAFLRWLRQVICFHGPFHTEPWAMGDLEVCDRCGKVTEKIHYDF